MQKNGDLSMCRVCVCVRAGCYGTGGALGLCVRGDFHIFFPFFFLCGRGNFTGGGGCCLYLKFTNLLLETGIP